MGDLVLAATFDVWQVRRLVQGCYDAKEMAERISRVEVMGGREQGQGADAGHDGTQGSLRQPGARAGHPQQAIRFVYRLLHRILSPPLAAGAPPAAEGGRGSEGGASVQEVAQRLDGALGFLQDSYWDWLRLEWLPTIQVFACTTWCASAAAAVSRAGTPVPVPARGATSS